MDIEKFEDLLRSKKWDEVPIDGAHDAWRELASQISPTQSPIGLVKSTSLMFKLSLAAACILMVGFVYLLGYKVGEKANDVVQNKPATIPTSTVNVNTNVENISAQLHNENQVVDAKSTFHTDTNKDLNTVANPKDGENGSKINMSKKNNPKSIDQNITLNKNDQQDHQKIANQKFDFKTPSQDIAIIRNLEINESKNSNLVLAESQINSNKVSVSTTSSATQITELAYNDEAIENRSQPAKSAIVTFLENIPLHDLHTMDAAQPINMRVDWTAPIVIQRSYTPKNNIALYANTYPKAHSVGYMANYSRKVVGKWSLEAGYAQFGGDKDIPPLRNDPKDPKGPKGIHVPDKIVKHDRPMDPKYHLHDMTFEFENRFINLGLKYQLIKYLQVGVGGEYVKAQIENSKFNYKAPDSDVILPVVQPAANFSSYYTPYVMAQVDYPVFRNFNLSARFDVMPSLNDDIKFYNKDNNIRGSIGLSYNF